MAGSSLTSVPASIAACSAFVGILPGLGPSCALASRTPTELSSRSSSITPRAASAPGSSLASHFALASLFWAEGRAEEKIFQKRDGGGLKHRAAAAATEEEADKSYKGGSPPKKMEEENKTSVCLQSFVCWSIVHVSWVGERECLHSRFPLRRFLSFPREIPLRLSLLVNPQPSLSPFTFVSFLRLPAGGGS